MGGVYAFRVHVTRTEDEEPPADEPAAASTSAAPVRTIRVEEASISSEQLLIEVALQEDCPCLQESSEWAASDLGAVDSDAVLCSGHGRFRCGMCLCEPGWLGKRCDCDASNYGSSREVQHQCRLPAAAVAAVQAAAGGGGSTAGLRPGAICADRGECTCGQCLCNLGFTGTHCECEQCLL